MWLLQDASVQKQHTCSSKPYASRSEPGSAARSKHVQSFRPSGDASKESRAVPSKHAVVFMRVFRCCFFIYACQNIDTLKIDSFYGKGFPSPPNTSTMALESGPTVAELESVIERMKKALETGGDRWPCVHFGFSLGACDSAGAPERVTCDMCGSGDREGLIHISRRTTTRTTDKMAVKHFKSTPSSQLTDEGL